jgi:hypothetical protein
VVSKLALANPIAGNIFPIQLNNTTILASPLQPARKEESDGLAGLAGGVLGGIIGRRLILR